MLALQTVISVACHAHSAARTAGTDGFRQKPRPRLGMWLVSGRQCGSPVRAFCEMVGAASSLFLESAPLDTLSVRQDSSTGGLWEEDVPRPAMTGACCGAVSSPPKHSGADLSPAGSVGTRVVRAPPPGGRAASCLQQPLSSCIELHGTGRSLDSLGFLPF